MTSLFWADVTNQRLSVCRLRKVAQPTSTNAGGKPNRVSRLASPDDNGTPPQPPTDQSPRGSNGRFSFKSVIWIVALVLVATAGIVFIAAFLWILPTLHRLRRRPMIVPLPATLSAT